MRQPAADIPLVHASSAYSGKLPMCNALTNAMRHCEAVKPPYLTASMLVLTRCLGSPLHMVCHPAVMQRGTLMCRKQQIRGPT